MVPFLAIGAFAGVRHAEIQRLDWKDVRFDAGIIEIHAGNAKTATPADGADSAESAGLAVEAQAGRAGRCARSPT